MHIRQAFILAAGYGTRLRPLTLHTPKPLLPIAGRPLLNYHLMHLHKHGIEEVFINTFHLSDQIIDYAKKQSFGIKVTISREEGEILGTAGGVMKQIDHLDDEFLVTYGDNLTNVNYSDYFSFLKDKEYDASIVLYHENHITQKGMAIVDDIGYISGFIEKPKQEQVISDLANAGIYVLKKSIFSQYTPTTGFSDFGIDFFPALVRDHKKILAYTTNDLLLDIGSFENLDKAQAIAKTYF